MIDEHRCPNMPTGYKLFPMQLPEFEVYIGDKKSNPLVMAIEYCPWCGQSKDLIALGLVQDTCVWVKDVSRYPDDFNVEVYDHHVQGATQCRILKSS